jgi:hypothetical protein
METGFIDIGVLGDYFRFCRWIESSKKGVLEHLKGVLEHLNSIIMSMVKIKNRLRVGGLPREYYC